MGMEKRRFARYKTLARSEIYDGTGLRALGNGYITEVSQGGAIFETAADVSADGDVYIPLPRLNRPPVWISARIKRKKKRPAATCYAVEFDRKGFFLNMQLKKAVSKMRMDN